MKYTVVELNYIVEKAWYENEMICLLFSDKRELRFPVSRNLKLMNGTEEQRKNIEIICNGTGLHWKDLDEDLSVLGIIEGRFD